MAPVALRLASAAPAVASRPSTSGRSSSRVSGLGLGLRRSAPAFGRRAAPVVAALPEKEKTLTREDEPEEYWMSEAEAQGKNPFEVSLPSLPGRV